MENTNIIKKVFSDSASTQDLIAVGNNTYDAGNNIKVTSVSVNATSTDTSARTIKLNAIGPNGTTTLLDTAILATASATYVFSDPQNLVRQNNAINKLQLAIGSITRDKAVTVRAIVNYE